MILSMKSKVLSAKYCMFSLKPHRDEVKQLPGPRLLEVEQLLDATFLDRAVLRLAQNTPFAGEVLRRREPVHQNTDQYQSDKSRRIVETQAKSQAISQNPAKTAS